MIRSDFVMVAALSGAAVAAPVVDVQAPTSVTAVTSEMLDRLPSGRRIEDLVRTCPSQTIPTVNRNSLVLIDEVSAQPAIECLRPDDIEMIEVLKTHNDLRAQYGSRPLAWDPVLAAQARSYGPTLAQYDRPVHSPRTGREWSRENLLQALRGTPTSGMLNVWVGESRYFTPGIFPNVSTTGNWADVGHLTQMLWADTTTVGCAVQRGIGNFDWLICRYAPAGNKDGKMVLAEREKEPPLPPTTGGTILHPKGIPAPQWARNDPCSPTALVVADIRVPWKLDKPKPQPDGTPTPPPESILDDVGQDPAPPPESILDDVGQDPAPPPESILDDVGQFQTDMRETPPSPPRTEKGKAVHDRPMAQPQYPNVEPRCVEMARDVPERCPDTPPPPCRGEGTCDLDMTKPPTLDPTRVRPTSDSPASLYTYRQAARDRFYNALKTGDWYGADIELVEMEYVLDEILKTDNDMLKRQFERQLKTDKESRLRGGCD